MLIPLKRFRPLTSVRGPQVGPDPWVGNHWPIGTPSLNVDEE